MCLVELMVSPLGAEAIGGQSSKAMADQIMAADKTRLKSQLGTLQKADMLAVEDAIKIHLSMPR